MKFVFINSSRRFLADVFLPVLLGIVVFAAAKAEAQQLSYTNIGIFPANSPTVNATNIYNVGSWNVATSPLPYTTLNTLNYNNSGSMSGSVGWNFSLNTSGDSNFWSASFTNSGYLPGKSNGSITVISSLGGLPQLFPVGYLLVSATNLVNKGLLSADTYSTIRLTGSKVDVSRSYIQISPVSAAGSADDNSQSDFTPSQSIYDEYWGEGAATKLNSAAIANSFINSTIITAQSPAPQTPNPAYPIALTCNGTGSASVFVEPATLVSALNIPSGISHMAITNQVIITNMIAYTNQFVYTNMGVLATNLVAFTNFMYQVTNVVPAMINIVSNLNRQAVFVGTADPNISSAVRYSPGDAGSNLETVTVQLAVPYTNLTTVTVQTNYIYVSDTLASEPYTGLYVNNFESVYPCYDFTYRPANYIVSRSDPGTFAGGSPGNATFTNNFLYSSAGQSLTNSVNSLYTDATNPVINANYALYSATVDNEAIPSASVGNVTDLPGNIRITANNLNLSSSIIQAEGEVMIKATNLVSSAGAVIDCPNLDYNVGSTNGFLIFTNLAKPSVSRLHGTVNLWSADWVNQASVLTTNYAFTTNAVVVTNGVTATTNLIASTNSFIITNLVIIPNTDSNGVVTSLNTNAIVSTNITVSTVTASVSTNPVAIAYSVLLMDASGLATSLPVEVQNLSLNSANAVVGDSMNIANGVYFSGTNLTLDGAINMLGTNWNQGLAPNLLYFTNNNNLNIGGTADFGDDRATPYIAFVNNGSINASSVNISSSYYQESGVENASPSGFAVEDAIGEVVNGSINSGQDIDFNGLSLALTNANLSAADSVNFTVATSLIDAANYAAPNQVTSVYGFDMWVKPTTCNLLGTEFIVSPPANGEADSTWAGQNLGAVVAGFSNNAAIGMLVLAPQSEVYLPLFTFSGTNSTGTTNALYVDDLNLSQLSTNDFADLENQLQINPSLIIYYASAQLGFTPPTKTVGTNNVPQEPEEFLNGQFGGHLVWVSSYAGAYSSTNIVINGQTVSVNSALANSQIIDSNGNGIPNAFDPNPFGFVISGSLSTTNAPINKVFTISWVAVANSTYQIQFTTNLILGNWQLLLNYTNSTSTNQSIMINDTNKLSSQRFYRELNLGQ